MTVDGFLAVPLYELQGLQVKHYFLHLALNLACTIPISVIVEASLILRLRFVLEVRMFIDWAQILI